MVKMKWLLIAIFCFSSASAALVGSNRCTWGPSYWCKDVQTAKKCSAMPHCVRMWKVEPSTPVSGAGTCLFCKVVVEGLKMMIANNKTQAEIKELAEKACELIKKEKAAYEVCNTIVYLYLPEVLKMIDSEIDTDTICKKIQLCSSSKVANKSNRPKEVLPKAKSVKGAEHCDECKLGVGMLKSYFADKAVQKRLIASLGQEVCPKLSGEFKALCNNFVANELPELFKFVVQIMDPETVCAALKLCPKTLHRSLVHDLLVKLAKMQKLRASVVECQLCQIGISDIRNTFRDASFQKLVENFLKTEVCARLGSLEQACQQRVTQFFPLLVKFVINELNPAVTCNALGLCQTSTRPAMRLSPAKVTHRSSPRGTPLCVICEFVMNKLESMLGGNHTEAAIVSALEKVCDIMPASVRGECDSFVTTYTPQLIKLLERLAPTLVCTTLGLCAGETGRSTDYLFQKLERHGNFL